MEEVDIMVITLKFFPSSHTNFIEIVSITSIDKDLTFEWFSTKLLLQNQFENNSGIEPSEEVLEMKFKSKGNKQNKKNDRNKELSKSRKVLNAFILASQSI